jgi:hypothetical protein
MSSKWNAPYIVRFTHANDDGGPIEEMFLCLHADSIVLAAEKFWSMLGGVGQPNVLVSIKTEMGVEAYYDRQSGKFVTIPEREG